MQITGKDDVKASELRSRNAYFLNFNPKPQLHINAKLLVEHLF